MVYLLSKSRTTVLGVGNMKKEYKASAKLYKAGKFMMTGVVAVALMGGATQAVVQPSVSAATKVSKAQRVKLVKTAKSAAAVATAKAKVASSTARVATADSVAASKAQSTARSAVAAGSTAAKSASSVATTTKALQNAKTTTQVNKANANIGVVTKYVNQAGSAVHTASVASSAATSASKQASTAVANASVATKAVSSAAKRASSAAKVAKSTAANTAKSTASKANKQAKSYATVASTKYKNVRATTSAVKANLATTKKNVSLAQSAAVVTTKAANNAMSNFYDYVATVGNSNNAAQSSASASAALSVSVAASKAASASSSASVTASKSAASVAASKAASASSSASVATSKSATSVATSTSSSAVADQLHMTDAEKLAAIQTEAYNQLNAYRAQFGGTEVKRDANVEAFAQKNIDDIMDGTVKAYVTDPTTGSVVAGPDSAHKNFNANGTGVIATNYDADGNSLMLIGENASAVGVTSVDTYVAGPKTGHDSINGDNDGDNMTEAGTQIKLSEIKTQQDIVHAAYSLVYGFGLDSGHKKGNLKEADDGAQATSQVYAGIAVGTNTFNGADDVLIAYIDTAELTNWF